MSCSLCRTILWKFVLGSFVSWHPPWPSYVLSSLLLWFLLSTEKGWEYFSLFYFQVTQLSCLHELRPRLTSFCSCLTVGGAAFLNIFNSSSSVSVDKLVDKSLHMTVFSRSLISSSRVIGVSSWIILTGTACLCFCKEKKHIGLNSCFAWSQEIFLHSWGVGQSVSIYKGWPLLNHVAWIKRQLKWTVKSTPAKMNLTNPNPKSYHNFNIQIWVWIFNSNDYVSSLIGSIWLL